MPCNPCILARTATMHASRRSRALYAIFAGSVTATARANVRSNSARAAAAAAARAVAAHQWSIFVPQAPLLVGAGMCIHNLQHLVCVAVVACDVPRHGLQAVQPQSGPCCVCEVQLHQWLAQATMGAAISAPRPCLERGLSHVGPGVSR